MQLRLHFATSSGQGMDLHLWQRAGAPPGTLSGYIRVWNGLLDAQQMAVEAVVR